MNPDKVKTVEIYGRKFQIYKMSAKASLKVIKILAAKVLPFLNIDGKFPETDNMDELLSIISLEKIADAIGHINGDDLEKLINYGLSHCYEKLTGGATQVLNSNGTYGVMGIENDMIFTLRLTIEVIAWSVSGIFRRKLLGFDVSGYGRHVQDECARFDELHGVNFLFQPVIAGHWKHYETWDGTYDLDDLMDIVEVMQVQAENKRRAGEQAEI